jgi:hypothetical protein
MGRSKVSVVKSIQVLLLIVHLQRGVQTRFGHQEFLWQGCIPEVYDFKELISWCIDKFDKNQRIIQLQGESPISLAPSVFKKMLRLLEPTMIFKGDEAKEFYEGKKWWIGPSARVSSRPNNDSRRPIKYPG